MTQILKAKSTEAAQSIVLILMLEKQDLVSWVEELIIMSITNRNLNHLTILEHGFRPYFDCSKFLRLDEPGLFLVVRVSDIHLSFLFDLVKLLLGGLTSIHEVQLLHFDQSLLIKAQLL